MKKIPGRGNSTRQAPNGLKKQSASAGKIPALAGDTSENIFRSLFDAIGEPTLVVDSENGDIVFANLVGCEFYGYSREKLTSMKIMDLVTLPVEQAKVIVGKIASGEIRRMEVRHILANGEVRDVEVFLGRQSFSGKILNIATVIDITRRKQAEKQIKLREELSRLVMDKMEEGVIILDRDWRYIYINDAAEYQGQRPRAELLGKTVQECWPGFEETEMFKLEKKVMDTGVPAQIEDTFRMPDGLEHWFEWRIQSVMEGLLILTLDITERKRLEEANRAVEMLYRNIFYNVDVIELLIDPVDSRIVQANQAAERFYGWTMAELESMNIGQINMLSQDQINLSVQAVVRHERNVFHRQHRLASGEIREVEIYSTPVTLQGRVLLFSLISDVTERVKAEEALRESEQNYRKLQERLNNAINAANLGTWLWNVQTGEVVFNERWAEILGYTLQELLPTTINTWADFCHPDDLKVSAKELERVFSHQTEQYQADCRMKHRNGEWIWVYDQGSVIEWAPDGKPLWMTGTHTDITARKLAEQSVMQARAELENRVQERTAELNMVNESLKKAMRARDEFMAAMSHELRTPLTGIIGLSQVLKMPSYGVLSPKQANAVENIYQSGQRLLDMVNDVLLYAELQSGKMSASPRPVWMLAVCQDALGLVVLLAEKKHQAVHFELEPEDMQLLVDDRHVHTILMNLLKNAVKFTPEGGELGMQVRGNLEERKVFICIWDKGIGIRQEDFSRLFQPFVQLDASLARQYEGTGLGLALVRLLAELLGGSVAVESTLGEGSRFTVILPWNVGYPK